MSAPRDSVNKSTIRRIRMKKEDSAFVYFVLESHEGICSYSTLPLEAGAGHLDMILRVPPGMEEDVQEVLKQLGDKVYEIQ